LSYADKDKDYTYGDEDSVRYPETVFVEQGYHYLKAEEIVDKPCAMLIARNKKQQAQRQTNTNCYTGSPDLYMSVHEIV